MQAVIVVIHVLAALGVVGLVLIQQGKGADMGAAFGSGASATVFGSQGAGSFITRATGVLATLFFITSLSLAYFSGQVGPRQSVTEQVETLMNKPMAEPAIADIPALPGSMDQGSAESDTPVINPGQ